jgi:hypothetical protein
VILPQYFSHLDGPDPMGGLSRTTPDVRFMIVLPDRALEGNGQADLADYIANRNVEGLGRVHKILASAADGGVEFHYGVVEERGTRIGMFLGAVHTTPDGRFDRYVNVFQTRVPLLGE